MALGSNPRAANEPESRLPEFKAWFLHLLAPRPWVPFELSFLICEMGLMIVPMVWDCHRQYEFTHRKAREQHLAHGDCSINISYDDDDKRGDGGSQSKLTRKRE